MNHGLWRFVVKAKEMREKTMEELNHLLGQWREEIFTLNTQAVTGQTEQYGRLRKLKKDIARALTILKEHEGAGVARKAEREVS
jgi:large subunit ribosomal protein L29